MAAPTAFLCHASADKALVADRLARDLRANGIEVWYDRWEISPGDSLRQKIDEGIEGATHFLALMTPNSVKSRWAQTELDAGMVKKIEGTCRLIPVLVERAGTSPLATASRSKRLWWSWLDAGQTSWR